MHNGLTFHTFKNSVVFGAGILVAGLVITGPATANENAQALPQEVVIIEEEFATEALDMDVAGENLDKATNKDDCQSEVKVAANDPACPGGNN